MDSDVLDNLKPGESVEIEINGVRLRVEKRPDGTPVAFDPPACTCGAGECGIHTRECVRFQWLLKNGLIRG